MSKITEQYENIFLQRFDKDVAIPYYSASDFEGLICEENSFQNKDNITIQYFI